MRAISGGARALLASGRFRFSAKCELTNQSGAWQDMTAFLGLNWLDSATWTESADQPVSTGSVTLARETQGVGAYAGGLVSLAPIVGASPANQAAGGYAPFLVEGRGVRISVAVTAAGVAPLAGDFVEVFVGQYDAVTVASDKNEIVLEMRDLGARVVDAWVREAKTYADAADFPDGVALEDVVQQMLDDALGVGVVALSVPVATGTLVSNVAIERKSLMEAVRDVALMIGWDVRYRYDSAGVSRLTLTRPARELTQADAPMTWFAASEYIAVPRLNTSVVDVRNIVRVDYTDAESGERAHAELRDAGSIALYGERWMQLAFAAASTINTADEAETLAAAALSDLAYPFSDHDVELFPAFWPAQLGDFYGFRANGRVYDSDQQFGVFGFTHTLQLASGSTTLVTKGRVVGAFREWQRRSGSEAGAPAEATSEDTRALALKNFREVRRTPTAVTYGFTPSADVDEIDAWGKLSPQDVDPPLAPGANEDRLWRVTDGAAAEPPDVRLDKTTREFEVAVPPFGNVQTWELVPFDAKGRRGYSQRVKVLSTPDVPRIASIDMVEGASGLFKDIVAVNVVDPQALGGTLRAWLNHDSPDSADSGGAPDGSITTAVTPHTFTNGDTWQLTGGGTAQLLDNVRIHPGAGKHVYFEFVNTRGTSSGLVGFVLLSNGGIVTPDGELKDASINRAEQVAASMTLPSVYDTLPALGRANELALLTTDGRLYRWTAGAWTLEVPASGVSGQITGTQITNGAISTPKLAAGAVTANELAANSVTAGKILAAAVTATAIAAGAVTAIKLSITLLSEVSTDAGVIVAGKLQSVDGARYLDLNATGANPFLHHPALDLRSDGTATFSGALSAASGTFAGSLSAATGTFAGSLSAAGGTFSGTVESSAFTTGHADFSGSASFYDVVEIHRQAFGPATAYLGFYNPSAVLKGYMLLDSGDGVALWADSTMQIGVATGNIIVNVGGAYAIVFNAGGVEVGRLDVPSSTVGDIGLMVMHRQDDGSLHYARVTVGGTNSAGSGWRVMRTAN